MAITAEWLIKNGVDPLALDRAMGKSQSQSQPLAVAPSPVSRPGRRPTVARNDAGMNKTEARFDGHLADRKALSQIADYRFEPFNLKLPGRVWFRIDFVVKRRDRSLVLIDVKGGWIEEDARLKLKTCSEVCAWLGDTYVACYEHRCWNLYPVGGGRVSTVPDLNWMEGCSWSNK